MTTNITMKTANPLARAGAQSDPSTLADLARIEMQWSREFCESVPMRDPREAEFKPAVRMHTRKDIDPKTVWLLETCAQVYGPTYGLFITRQMVIAVNFLLRRQTTCPSAFNQNYYCKTVVDGLYRLPDWCFSKDLLSTLKVRSTTKTRRTYPKPVANTIQVEAPKTEETAQNLTGA